MMPSSASKGPPILTPIARGLTGPSIRRSPNTQIVSHIASKFPFGGLSATTSARMAPELVPSAAAILVPPTSKARIASPRCLASSAGPGSATAGSGGSEGGIVNKSPVSSCPVARLNYAGRRASQSSYAFSSWLAAMARPRASQVGCPAFLSGRSVTLADRYRMV
jgi:hypothetical protein